MFLFEKYHATGNDFVMIDNRSKSVDTDDQDFWATVCHRRFGIGADGVIFIQNSQQGDFEMVYLNSDGRRSSFCGNGSRATVLFAKYLNLFDGQETVFEAIDGLHKANICSDNMVSVLMQPAKGYTVIDKSNYTLDTGSPHYVQLCSKRLKDINFIDYCKAIRYSQPYSQNGINVNLVNIIDNAVFIRTYERGVEDETYSCGTGATAVATVLNKTQPQLFGTGNSIDINVVGGVLSVSFYATETWLSGPAVRVYNGIWN